MFETLKKILLNNRGTAEKNSAFRILVVEDSVVDRTFLEKTLSQAGYRVAAADTAEKGLELTQTQTFDLIVLDCVLPGISGIDACRRLKDNRATRNIPIIFLTGIDTPKNVVDCYDFGAECFLSKPIGGRELLNQITHILSRSKA